MKTFLLIAFIYHLWHCCAALEVLRPRGVSLSKKIFYVPDQDFKCIDGSGTVPFSFVNDDYCDCEDGSDEPGTSACSNAVFTCINSGHVSFTIPTSRVNDNICDCCDGGDEYNSTQECVNICLELGKQAREERQKLQELYEQGFSLWQQYSTEGKQLKENSKAQLESLKKVEIEEEKLLSEEEAKKNEAEEKEKAALAIYESIKEEQEKQKEELEKLKQEEEEKREAEAAFQELDGNGDGVLTTQELQRFQKFDTDHDGQVSEDEAKIFLLMKDSIELEEFVTMAWMTVKPIYFLDKVPATPLPVGDELEKETTESEELGEEESDDETYNPDEDTLEEDLDDSEPEKPPVFPPKVDEPKPDSPKYDEETQQLVDAANEARKNYNEVVTRLEKIKDEYKQLQEFIDADYGSGEQFAVLKGKCFDFEDREYTYRFCPFDKASQIAKSGGSDVNLGRWGSWAGPEEDKYSKMKYDNGQLCWNGPSRSVIVLLQCGLENKLMSSSEPNRCEYLFEFSTPAMCSLNENTNRVHQHTEL